MSRFVVFSSRWWADKANTQPATLPRRRITVRVVETEAEARAICRAHNFDADGNRIVRPYGSAYEYEGT